MRIYALSLVAEYPIPISDTRNAGGQEEIATDINCFRAKKRNYGYLKLGRTFLSSRKKNKDMETINNKYWADHKQKSVIKTENEYFHFIVGQH